MIIDTIISLYIFYNLIVIILVSATIDVQCILIRLEELVYWKITYILSFHPWTINYVWNTLWVFFTLHISLSINVLILFRSFLELLFIFPEKRTVLFFCKFYWIFSSLPFLKSTLGGSIRHDLNYSLLLKLSKSL